MKKFFAMLLIATLVLASVSALASGVYIGALYGDTNVRTGPGLGYQSIGTLMQGEALDFAGNIRYDDRGVAWYQVWWNYGAAWVSSRYTVMLY